MFPVPGTDVIIDVLSVGTRLDQSATFDFLFACHSALSSIMKIRKPEAIPPTSSWGQHNKVIGLDVVGQKPLQRSDPSLTYRVLDDTITGITEFFARGREADYYSITFLLRVTKAKGDAGIAVAWGQLFQVKSSRVSLKFAK